jgi:Putative peptidoglycan binding domain
MKKITNLLIVVSLALAGAVMAQEPSPSAEQSPGKKQKKEQPAEVKPAATRPPKTESPAVKEPAARRQPKPEAPAVKEPATNQAPETTKPETTTKSETKGPKNKRNTPPTTAPNTKAEQPATTPAPTATPDTTKNQSRRNKNTKAPAANATATAAPSASVSASPATSPKTKPTASAPAAKSTPTASPAPTTPAATTTSTAGGTPAATPAIGATPTPATTPAASASVSQSTSTTTAATKKPDPTKIEQIKQQHTSFRAQPKPDRVPAVTFSANFRLPGSDRWQGPQYEVYRSYHPERHDRGWYHQHYQRVELIAGGYYYFNNGYWYPAWGYDPGNQYYAYDAPIYVGHRSDPPDKVIADVQAALQEMGYYKGEVDGLIGPLTREALTQYQSDNGMTVTAVIDEPTLDSLGMG